MARKGVVKGEAWSFQHAHDGCCGVEVARVGRVNRQKREPLLFQEVVADDLHGWVANKAAGVLHKDGARTIAAHVACCASLARFALRRVLRPSRDRSWRPLCSLA